MIGVEERETATGIHVVRLHYTADPLKRTQEWLKEAKRGMSPRAWAKEYEIDWTVASGLPVYAEDFRRDWHVASEPLEHSENVEMLRGWDLGATHQFPACVWGQLTNRGRTLMILREMVTWDGRGDPVSADVGSFADAVIVESNTYFPCERGWIDYSDPAAWTKSQVGQEAKSAADELRDRKIYPRKGPVTFKDRQAAILDRLRMAQGGEPAILIDPSCRMIIEGLAGAYKYEEVGETGRYKATVEKNAWSHVMNALEYLVGGVYAPERKDEDEHRRKRRVKRDKVTGY